MEDWKTVSILVLAFIMLLAGFSMGYKIGRYNGWMEGFDTGHESAMEGTRRAHEASEARRKANPRTYRHVCP